MIKRIIPSSRKELPVIGLGTWKSFDVSDNKSLSILKDILTSFHNAGGRLIDSSPMYGKAEQVIGNITSEMKTADDFFYATKVWTKGLQNGIGQMEASMQKMNRKTIDLMQIHNLTDWQTHLPVLKRWKEEKIIRYTGITHYTDSSHEELESVLKKEKIDFVQFNYSILSRHAEKRLLSVAADLGVAVIINRPLGEGTLFGKVKGKPLPSWAKEMQIETWGVYFLKYILASPSVTCVIPATSDPEHAADNFMAGIGTLPDPKMKNKMVEYLENL
jgi:diketogulonate reductase-like aldo/keto reductase